MRKYLEGYSSMKLDQKANVARIAEKVAEYRAKETEENKRYAHRNLKDLVRIMIYYPDLDTLNKSLTDFINSDMRKDNFDGPGWDYVILEVKPKLWDAKKGQPHKL